MNYQKKGVRVKKLMLELYPASEILTRETFKKKMTMGWGSYMFNVSQSHSALEEIVNLPGLSSVRFSFEVERGVYLIPAHPGIPGLEIETEVEFPKVTVDDINIEISRKTTTNVKQLRGFMNSGFNNESLIIREGNIRVKPGAILPGLLRVTISVHIHIADLIEMPEDQLSTIQKYLPSETNPKSALTWGKYKPWNGYTTEMFILAYFLNGFEFDRFKAIFEDKNPLFETIFTCRGFAENLSKRWDWMKLNLETVPVEASPSGPKQTKMVISVDYLKLFGILIKVAKAYDDAMKDKPFKRSPEHWGHFLKCEPEFEQLIQSPTLPERLSDYLSEASSIARNPEMDCNEITGNETQILITYKDAADKEKDATDKESNATDKESNATDKESNATDKESNATDKESNAADMDVS